jgi:CRISPR-associated endonuclease/helicase Cas3
LVYVVNRRTVVDQATREAEQMREALGTSGLAPEASLLRALGAVASDCPLAISTLRGQFADNAEWRIDPARPAIVVGTVDMIGSRLLFSGYGCGFKSRPLHAGFLGQDSLLVHDEAHLEPAFQTLITAIENEQKRCRDVRPLRVMALTATSRDNQSACGLTEAERNPGSVPNAGEPLREVWKRTSAKKGIKFHPVSKDTIPDRVVELAKDYQNSGQAILVFLRKVNDLEEVAAQLPKGKTQTLAGTMRGYERDALVRENPVFARFLRKPPTGVAPESGTVYLVCTSAGEVGVNISADHLVCDLTPFDSMAQRFGRVNRFGDGDASIDIVHAVLDLPKGNTPKTDYVQGAPVSADGTAAEGGRREDDASGSSNAQEGAREAENAEDGVSAFDRACARTVRLLERLPVRDDGRRDASSIGLAALPPEDRQAAFTPPPVIPAVTDILFDAWALTSVREKMPGRPPVAEWLHGIAAWEEPETHVAWREEVNILRDSILDQTTPEDLLDDYPLKPHELLRDVTGRIEREIKNLAKKPGNTLLPVWLRDAEGKVVVMTLADVVDGDDVDLRGMTILLPPQMGGLSDRGTLDGKTQHDEGTSYDVADEWKDEHGFVRRMRVWDDALKPQGMRLVCAIDCNPSAAEATEGDEEGGRRWWRWYAQPRSADDEGSQTAANPQGLAPHLAWASHFGTKLVARLPLDEPERVAVLLATGWHDRGKHRAIWQRAVGNWDYPKTVLAKPAGKMNIANLSNYRHELGSLLEVLADEKFSLLSKEVQDLVLHFIASHHGRARPHFLEGEAFDNEHPESLAIAEACEAPRRFARLQRRYGRWGLAYLESLLRAADALASQADGVGPAGSDERNVTGGVR